jgi:hypothetical protein
MNVGATRTGYGTTQGATPDQRMQDIQTHIGNRSVGGRFVSWMKNKDGITPKEQRLMNSFQKALSDKLGSREAVNVLFKELQLSPDRPLSVRKMQVAMDTADQMVTDRDKYTKTRDSQIAKNLTAEQTAAKAEAAARARAAKDGRPYVPLKQAMSKVEVDDKLSPSAAALRSAITSKLQGTPDENSRAAKAILKCLSLKENEEITDAHIDTANKLVQRYEESRGSQLHSEMGPGRFPDYFQATFTNIVANGWDPRADLLSTDELVALNAYTQIDYSIINEELRNGPISPLTRTTTDLCIQGLNKLPPYDGPVSRGTDLPRDKDQACVRGGTMTDRAFTSTSATKSFDGSHQFSIHSPGGRDVSFLSKFPDEVEVLYPPNHKFQIVSRVGTVDYGGKTDPTSKTVDPGVTQATILLK